MRLFNPQTGFYEDWSPRATSERARALREHAALAGVNLRSLAGAFWKLDAMRSEGKRLPTLTLRAYTRGTRAWGTAFIGLHAITFWVPVLCEPRSAAEVLLHELVHCALPPGTDHSELFCRRLIACANEAFGLALDPAKLLGMRRGIHSRLAYAIDEEIRSAIPETWWASAQQAHPAQPQPSADDRRKLAEARREARFEERRAHAAAKLEEWERAVARAERLAASWRKRVRYYDREAVRREAAKKR